MMTGVDIREVETPWQCAILVCGKCGRRNEGKLGGIDADDVRKSLKKALKDVRPRVRVVETGCQDVCPKSVLVTCIGGVMPKTSWIVTSERDIEAIALRLRPNAD